ncbi:hypothetical protein PQ689_03140 [Thermoanaerobacterium thermosaccharolyticum]
MILTNIDDYFKLVSRYFELIQELKKVSDEIANFKPMCITSEVEHEIIKN